MLTQDEMFVVKTEKKKLYNDNNNNDDKISGDGYSSSLCSRSQMQISAQK